MNRKIQFTVILIGWVSLILTGSIMAGDIEMNSYEDEESFIPNTQSNRDPNKKIIIRIDDVQARQLNDITITMIKSFLERGMAVSAGVIPRYINEDPKIVDFIKSRHNDPNFEIVQHGTYHTENEFLELNKEEAQRLIKIGREKIIQTFDYTPITFIPPYNEYNEDTLAALSELGFNVFSAKKNEYGQETLLIIGYNTRTKNANEKELNAVEDVIAECENALTSTNLCVILIHPSDYVDDGRFAYQDEFFDLLNNLEQLNATFITFENLKKS